MVYKTPVSTLKFLSIQCFSASATKKQAARAKVYCLLSLPVDSVAWIIWAKREPGIQPPLCMYHISSQVGSLSRSWETPKDGDICNRNMKICKNKALRDVSVCDWAPEEPAEQRVKCIDTPLKDTFSSSKMGASVIIPSQENLHYEKIPAQMTLQQTLHPNRRVAPTWQHIK